MDIVINGEQVFTLKDVSGITGYTARTLQEYARRHKLGFRVGGLRYYKRADLVFLQRLRKGAKCREKHG